MEKELTIALLIGLFLVGVVVGTSFGRIKIVRDDGTVCAEVK